MYSYIGCFMHCFVSNSGTAVLWRTTAGASTGSQSGTIDSLEIPELKVGVFCSVEAETKPLANCVYIHSQYRC